MYFWKTQKIIGTIQWDLESYLITKAHIHIYLSFWSQDLKELSYFANS